MIQAMVITNRDTGELLDIVQIGDTEPTVAFNRWVDTEERFTSQVNYKFETKPLTQLTAPPDPAAWQKTLQARQNEASWDIKPSAKRQEIADAQSE